MSGGAVRQSGSLARSNGKQVLPESRNYGLSRSVIESGVAPILVRPLAAPTGFLSCFDLEPSAMTPCTITEHYEGRSGQATWKGRSIADEPDFRAYLRGP